MMDTVSRKPTMSHQPPCASGGMLRPYCGAGGSRASQNSCWIRRSGLQSTEASMLKPMMLKASVPNTSEATPRPPR
jgi:hypothetical protein